jgi:hypothetical protein
MFVTGRLPYAIRIIALLASAVGKTIWKSPEVEDLFDPKSNTTTVSVVPDPAAVVVLYINAPRAVIVAEVYVLSAKSVRAVVPEVVGVTFVNAPPPAVYEPELLTSLDEVYAVVAAVNVALLSYRASLKVSPLEFVKL